jgi:hypothetical protein
MLSVELEAEADITVVPLDILPRVSLQLAVYSRVLMRRYGGINGLMLSEDVR